jgi:hypothetical protein
VSEKLVLLVDQPIDDSTLVEARLNENVAIWFEHERTVLTLFFMPRKLIVARRSRVGEDSFFRLEKMKELGRKDFQTAMELFNEWMVEIQEDGTSC